MVFDKIADLCGTAFAHATHIDKNKSTWTFEQTFIEMKQSTEYFTLFIKKNKICHSFIVLGFSSAANHSS